MMPPSAGGAGFPFPRGAPNRLRATGPPLPLVWLNELQLLNVTGPVDGRGQHEPWVELYNAGTSALDLSGFFLSNDPTNLTRWAFPPGTMLPAGQFQLVWLDGATGDHTTTEWHANFRLTSSDTILLLSRGVSGQPQVVDYLAFADLKTDQALARVPDGTSERPRVLDYATPASSNAGASPLPALYINEFMAANTLWRDPADGDADDWFELYNASERTVDLAGYTLTDKPGIPRKFVIPDGISIGPRSFLLVWADEEENQTRTNGDLHVNFRLNDAGEAIALYAPDGRLVESDSFGAQTLNTSLARWPDGSGSFTATTNATPGMRNKLNSYVPPILSLRIVILQGIGAKILFPAGHRAVIQCKGRLEDPAWTQVNGVRGYDASTDLEWMLDPLEPSIRQRFYQAVTAP